MVSTLISVAVGGAAGALGRFLLAGGVGRLLGGAAGGAARAPLFPWGTLVVNAVGALAIGVVWELTERSVLSEGVRPLLAVGLLGALTTFSTFSLETVQLMSDRLWGLAAANVLANNVVCLALTAGAIVATRALLTLGR